MKKSFLTLILSGLLLSSCGGDTTLNLSLMTPVGAPAIAVYKYAKSENWEPQDQPTNIAKAFTTANKDLLVFDAINGLRQVANNNAPYKLAKVITNGNLYMVSLNNKTKEDPIASDAKIVSFGENLIPDTAVKFLYPELVSQMSYVDSAQQAAAVVCSGLKEGGAIDYVIGAMPSIWNMMNKSDCATYGKVNIVKNIQEDMETATGLKGIPQAGIFVLNSTYETRENEVKEFLSTVKKSIDKVKTKPGEVYKELSKSMTDTEINKKFGFTKQSLLASFADGANLVGLTNEEVNINEFLRAIGVNEFDQSYFLDY